MFTFPYEKHLFRHATHETLHSKHCFFQTDQDRLRLDGRERESFQVTIVLKTKAVRKFPTAFVIQNHDVLT